MTSRQRATKERKLLLVDGYIKEHEKLLMLSNIIPTSIYAIIFEYQLLVDTWNKELSHSKSKISDNGSCLELFEETVPGYKYIFGTHCIKYGDNFQWTLEIIQGSKLALVLAVIPNNQRLTTIDESKSTEDGLPADFLRWDENGYLWAVSTGYFGYKGKPRKWTGQETFANTGDIVKVGVNWMDSLLHIIVNNQDLGTCDKEKWIEDCHDDKEKDFLLGLIILKKTKGDLKIKIDSDPF